LQINNLYFLFILFLNVVTFVLVNSYDFHGTAVLFKPVVNKEHLFPVLLFIIVGYFLLFIYLKKTLLFRKYYFINYSSYILDIFFFFVLIFNFLVFFIFGLGTAGSSNQSIGFLLNILPTNILTVIYFCLIKKYSFLSILNIILSVLLIFIKGWTGLLLIMVMITIFSKYNSLNFKKLLKLSIFATILLSLYYPLFLLKYYIREGVLFDISPFYAYEYALSRLTLFSNFCVYIDNIDEILIKTSDLKGDFFYVYDAILSLLPKSLFGINNYLPNDNIYATILDETLINSGIAMSLLGIYLLSINLNILNIILFPLFISILYFILYNLLALIWCKKIKYFYILSLLGTFYSGNIKEIVILIYSTFIFIIIFLFANFFSYEKK